MKWEALLDGAAPDGLVATPPLRETDLEHASRLSRQLCRWVRAGRLTRLRRGLYVVNAPYRSRAPHPFRVAALMLEPSYVSLETALAFHGIATVPSRAVSSVTTRRSATYETALGRFNYQVVKGPLFQGFEERELPDGQVALVATPEKALLDLLYLEPPATLSKRLAELDPGAFRSRLPWGRLVAMVDELGIARLSRALRRV